MIVLRQKEFISPRLQHLVYNRQWEIANREALRTQLLESMKHHQELENKALEAAKKLTEGKKVSQNERELIKKLIKNHPEVDWRVYNNYGRTSENSVGYFWSRDNNGNKVFEGFSRTPTVTLERELREAKKETPSAYHEYGHIMNLLEKNGIARNEIDQYARSGHHFYEGDGFSPNLKNLNSIVNENTHEIERMGLIDEMNGFQMGRLNDMVKEESAASSNALKEMYKNGANNKTMRMAKKEFDHYLDSYKNSYTMKNYLAKNMNANIYITPKRLELMERNENKMIDRMLGDGKSKKEIRDAVYDFRQKNGRLGGYRTDNSLKDTFDNKMASLGLLD